MLLQTNSYIVPADKRIEHQRLIRRFKQAMARLGCDLFDVYEQVGPNWAGGETTGRYVQIMRFRDQQHQRAVQSAERTDPTAQALIAEFCELINLPYQQQQGLFAVGFYRSVVKASDREETGREHEQEHAEQPAAAAEVLPDEQPMDEQGYGVDQPYSSEQAGTEGVEQASDQASAEAPAYAPEEAAGGEEPVEAATEQGTSFLDDLTTEEQEIEVEMEVEPDLQPQNGEQQSDAAVPPLALDDLDLEALAQEELSQRDQRSQDKDRARRGR